MYSAPNSCGFDTLLMKEIKAKLVSGELLSAFHRKHGRLFYVTPEEWAALDQSEYTLLQPGQALAQP